MAQTTYILTLNLQLFADGGAAGTAGDGGATAAGATGVTAADAAQQGKRGVKNPLADVIYGKQAADANGALDAAAQQPGTVTQPDADAAFEAMIKGQYKDQFGKKVEDIISRRLKGTKDKIDKLDRLQPLLGMLGQKYGADADDVDALTKAVEDDDSYWMEEADEKGVTVAQLKEIKRMERENADLKAQIEQAALQQEIHQNLAKWQAEAEEAAKTFPGLSFEQEMQNPAFFSLLKDGVSVPTAYFAIHHEELVPQAMQFAARTAQQQTADAIRAGQNRPNENGMRSQSAAVMKPDVTMLTKADRKEIARRVQRGERIAF